MDTKNGTVFKSDTRIGKSACIPDEDHLLLKTLNQRIEDMTQLNTKSASHWFVNSYDVGGFFAPHYDYTFNTNIFKGRGNRLASFLIYVSLSKFFLIIAQIALVNV